MLRNVLDDGVAAIDVGGQSLGLPRTENLRETLAHG